MLKKKLTKYLWFGSDVDSKGNPITPQPAPEGEPLDGLNEGELYIHNNSKNPTLYTLSSAGKVVPIGGNTDVLDKRYIRKDKDDRSKGNISSDKGFEVGKFESGTLGTGASMYEGEDKNTYIEADFLKIRKKATFTTITVQELKHVGGEIILSPAAMICSSVEETENGWKCYFNTEDSEGRKVYQEFVVDDLARCQTFNLSPKGANDLVGNHYYWRKVISVGDDYIELSKSECDAQSDAPQVGDNICQLGNKYNKERQNAIVLSAYGEDAPSYKQYKGINDFVLTNEMLVTKFSPKGNEITGILNIEKGSHGANNLEDFPDEVFKAVHVGSVNLLKNTGFTGNYRAEDLSNSSSLSSDSELYSKKLNHWTGEATVNEDSEAISGYSVTIGNLSQALELIKDESYVVSFKAKGTNVSVIVGRYSIEQELTNTWDKYYFKLTSDGIGTFTLSGDANICDIKLERGTIATDWSASPYDNDKALDEFKAIKYLSDAINNGSTDILGGLILSSMIQLGNYKDSKMQKVNAGISGIYNNDEDVAFWGGGNFEQAIRTISRFKENPNYKPTDKEWADMANFVVSHGGDVFLRGYINALGGIFRGSIFAESGELGGFFLGKDSMVSVNDETSVTQSMKISSSGLRFFYSGVIDGEVEYGMREYSQGDIPFIQAAYIENKSIKDWHLCGMRMKLKAPDLGMYIEGGSTHILSDYITRINGLVLNQTIITTDATIQANSDSIVFNNTSAITVTLLNYVPVGKVYYLKRLTSNGVTLKGSIRSSDSSEIVETYTLGPESIMLVRQTNGWTIYNCK